jgi:hypothetical protein
MKEKAITVSIREHQERLQWSEAHPKRESIRRQEHLVRQSGLQGAEGSREHQEGVDLLASNVST